MADWLDVTARLADGSPAAERLQTYVRACHQLGYHNADLTTHFAQIRDWYGSEAGLDLMVLDDDCAELRSAAAAVGEAAQIQRTQLGDLTAAWGGAGAEAAAGFLQRHCDSADAVAVAVRDAADTGAALRDDLWRLVDDKVSATVVIDDRSEVQRPAWLAASQTVFSGMADRSAAVEIVEQQVKPFVDNDIRVDWMAVMQKVRMSVAQAYADAVNRLTSLPPARFELPGDFGPRYPPPPVAGEGPAVGGRLPVQPMPVAAATPAAATAPSWPIDALPDVFGPMPPEVPLAGPAGLDAAAPDGLPTGASPLGASPGLAGIPDVASGIGGLAGQIADAVGGLSSGSGMAGPPMLDDLLGGDPAFDDMRADDPLSNDPFREALAADDEGAETEDDLSADADSQGDDQADDQADVADNDCGTLADGPVLPVGEAPAASAPGLAEAPAPLPGPPVTAPPPPTVPQPPPSAEATGSTPCEIAADELPQAGQ